MPSKALRRAPNSAIISRGRCVGLYHQNGGVRRFALTLVFGLALVIVLYCHAGGDPLHQELALRVIRMGGSAPLGMAARESFGFFDNIPDAEWNERQRRAREHKHQIDPTYKDVGHKENKNSARLWLLNNYYPLFSCPNVQRVGAGGDGPKWVCDPLRLRERKGRCLIYSVGCNGNYKFEDSLVDLVGVGTCEIHVFDVKPQFDREDGNTPRGIYFHPWGLKSSYSSATNGYHGEFMTLQETMKKLGHKGRTIDVFKIDCEGCEWTTYKDWISDEADIRQLLIETHGLAVQIGTKPSDFFDDIESAGFALFSKEPNIHPRAAPGCSEWSFVKLSTSFFGKRPASQ